jgi:toxin ParE1/3/4
MKFWPVFSYLIIYDPGHQPIGVARLLDGGQDIKALLKRHTPRP